MRFGSRTDLKYTHHLKLGDEKKGDYLLGASSPVPSIFSSHRLPEDVSNPMEGAITFGTCDEVRNYFNNNSLLIELDGRKSDGSACFVRAQ